MNKIKNNYNISSPRADIAKGYFSFHANKNFYKKHPTLPTIKENRIPLGGFRKNVKRQNHYIKAEQCLSTLRKFTKQFIII